MNALPSSALRNIKWRDVIDAVRRLSSAARHRNQDFGTAVDAHGAALAILSLDGRFIAANSGTAFLFGYTSDELLGRTLVDMAENDAKVIIRDGMSSCATGDFQSFCAALRGRDGRVCRIQVHQHPIVDDAGCTNAVLTIFEEHLHISTSSLDMPPPNAARTHRQYAHLMIGQERERKRIASELHDGLGQGLTLIKLTVEDALIRLHGGRIAEARELLDRAVVRLCEAIGDVRQICSELHPALLDRLGLVAAIASLCRRVDERGHDLHVRFDCGVCDDDVPENLKADIFRITQEAINNALRHGSANTIQVRLDRVETGILLAIQDDGIGFDTAPIETDPALVGGLGLIGMQQRVESAGGSFMIQSSAVGGTLVSALWSA